MANNKVIFGGQTIIDITSTTATESDVAQGKIFFKANGSQAIGSASGGGGGSVNIWQDQNGYVVLDDEVQSTQVITPLSVTANGTYTAPTGYAYNPITVNVSSGSGSVGVFGVQEFIAKIHDSTVALKDTQFAGWTPSTTAKSIYSTIEGEPYYCEYTADPMCFGIEWIVIFDPVYTNSATQTAQVTRYVFVGDLTEFYKPNSYTDLLTETFKRQTSMVDIPSTSYKSITTYYTTAGDLTDVIGNLTYGIYVNSMPQSDRSKVTSGGQDQWKITPALPNIYARVSSSYMSATNMESLDQNNSTIRIVGNLYKMTPQNNTLSIKMSQLVDIYNNGI